MKAFTDIEQSKKLVEILPIDSADMHYNVVGDAIIGDYQSGISSARSVAKAYKKSPDEFAKNVIPCWSLAALLESLELPTLEKNGIGKGKTGWMVTHYDVNGMRYDTTYHNNPIDACYEMILKLHEQKLL